MKKIFVVLAGLMLIAPLAAAEVNIGGILQGGFDKVLSDDAKVDFTLNRARLLFKGAVNTRIRFFVQTDMRLEAAEADTTGYITAANAELLDVKCIYNCPVLNTKFILGRFKPAYTYYMPMYTGKLDLINYPMLTKETGMDYQVGAQASTHMKMLGLTLGLFNGANDKNNWNDSSNDGKDLLVRGDFKMADINITAAGYYWLENALFAETDDAEGNKMGFYGTYTGMGLKVVAEYLATEDDGIKGAGYFAQAGYRFMDDMVETLFRYDSWDPNTANKDGENSETDATTRITLGLNCYVSGHDSMFYLNYIINGEHEDVELDNDQVVLQYQILF